MMSKSSPEAPPDAPKNKRSRRLGNKKSSMLSLSPPSEIPSSTGSVASRKSQRMTRPASPTSKKKTRVSGHRKGRGRQPKTRGAVSGAARAGLIDSSAAAVDEKAPETPSPISSLPVSPTSSIREDGSLAAPSGCRMEATTTMAYIADDESGVMPRKAPDSACVPATLEANVGQVEHVEPSAVARGFQTASKGADREHTHADSILDPASEHKPGHTTAQRPPLLPASNNKTDGAASMGSISGSLRKKLSLQSTKDMTPAEPSGASKKVPTDPAPAAMGPDYYTALRELATSIHTASTTPHGGSTNSRPSRLLHVLIVVAVTVVVVVLLYSRVWGSSGTLSDDNGICRTQECYLHASYFTRSLNHSADPCIDFGAFVCSKWKPSSDFIPTFTAGMIRTHIQRMTRLLREGLFIFNASSMSAGFLRECMEQTEDPDSLTNFKQFAASQGIPWPYETTSNSDRQEPHPLHVIFRLSVEWGIHTWFEVTFGEIEEDKKTTHALFIDTTIHPSAWLNFIRRLKEEHAREKYYQGFCKLFGVPFPRPAELQKRFDVEDSVLSIIHEVAMRGRHLIMEERPQKLAALTRNVSLAQWLKLAMLRAPPSINPSEVPFYFADKGIIRAIDTILYHHKHERVLEHLAWWFVQQHTVLASPSGHILFAGDKRRAQERMGAYCYKTVSEKMGLLLAAESAISLFSARKRESAEHMIDSLVDASGKFLRLLPWSEEGDLYMASRIAQIEIRDWPQKLESMDNRLHFLYRNFVNAADYTHSFFSDWIYTSEAVRNLNYEDYHRMHSSWQGQLRRLFVYGYWYNELQVSHAALAPPLYYTAKERVLRGATFGGFGSRCLAAVLRVINIAAFFLGKRDKIANLLNRDGIKLFMEPSCGSLYDHRLKDSLSVAAAWHLFKHSDSAAENRGTSLLAVDGRVFTAEQIFFMTYCRSLCEVNERNRCSDVLAQVRAFAAAFKCKLGTPMIMLNRCGIIKHFEEKLRNGSVVE